MGEKMTLETALSAMDRSIRVLRECRMPEHAAELTEARAAVSGAFVTQPAQAVDVGAIRDVISALQINATGCDAAKFPIFGNYLRTCADKLTAALYGKQP